MKKFMFLDVGFERPTPELMKAWESWFATIADKQVDQGVFRNGREISKNGTRELPWDLDSITGYNIVEAESLEAAETLARANPFVTSIRVYEMR